MKAIRYLIFLAIFLVVVYGILTVTYFGLYSDSKYAKGQDLEAAQDGQFVNLSTGEIFYREAGLGKKVIFLHGFGDSSASFEKIMEEMSSQYRVYALDFPGFGFSSKEKTNEMNLEEKVQTVLDFMDFKNTDKVYLVGHSMGGAVATQLAVDYPEKVEKLALISTAGYGDDHGAYSALKWIPPPLDKLFVRWFLFNNNTVKKNLDAAFYDDDLASIELVNQYLEPTQTKGADWSYLKNIKQGIASDLKDEFAKVTQSTLLIWGREDEMIPSDTMTSLRAIMPNSTGYFLEFTGHLVHLESPEGVASLLENFFSQIL